MKSLKKFNLVVIAAALLFGNISFQQADTTKANPPQVDDPSVPDVKILSPENTDCEPWDPTKTREENETVVCPWFPSMVKLANGDLYLAYYWSVSHSGQGVIAAQRSTDNGKTWSAQQIIVDDTSDDREPNLTVLKNGHVLMSYYDYVPGRINRRQVYVRRSTDNGVTWGPAIVPPSVVYDIPYKGNAATNGEIVEMDNGDLLLPIYGMRDYQGTQGNWGTYVLRSKDGGYTWLKEDERVVMWDGLVPFETSVGYVEPALANLGGGHVMMVARTSRPAGDPNANIMKISHSYDYGNTWSTPVDEPSLKGHAPHFLKLKGGTHLLTYGDRSNAWVQGRPVIGRMYIDSKGWSYTQSKLLYRNPGVFSDMSYQASVELEDGRIFTVYYDRGQGILAGTYTRPDPYQLDLWKMFLNGQVTYGTDMNHTASSRPEMQPWAPLDGNISYWNTAASDTGAPPYKYWTASISQPYAVTDVGIVLKPGYQESARVDVSVVGSGDWQVIKNYTMQQTDNYDWIPLRPERDVKHVRTNITDTTGNGHATFNDVAIRVAPTTFNRSRALKMDLWQLMRTGRATISGNMNYLDPTTTYPGLNPKGPIDGKAEYWYSAVANCTGCTGTWQVSLDENYTVDKVGLMLKPGYQESAVVEVSIDGSTWSAVGSLNMVNTTSMQYLTFPAASAKYVRVRVTQVSSGWPQLTEFELYMTTPMIQP